VQPGEAYLRDGAGTPSYHDAGVTCQRHQEIACVTHSARDDYGSRPIWRGHFIGWNYADHQSTRIHGVFGRDPRGWTAASAYQSYAEPSQESACFTR